jgi:hypothetical protein
MVEALSISEMLVNFYQTTWCNIPEDSNLQSFNVSLTHGPCETVNFGMRVIAQT